MKVSLDDGGIKKLIKYMTQSKNSVLYITINVFANILLAVYFWLYTYVTEAAEARNLKLLPFITVAVVLNILLLFLSFSMADYLKSSMVTSASWKLRDNIMNCIFRKNTSEMRKNDSSYYASILLNDVDFIESDYFTKITEMVGEITQLLVMVVAICLIEWRYLLIVLLFAIPSIIQPFLLKGKLGKAGIQVAQKTENYTRAVRDMVEGFEIIKIFQRERVFHQRFAAHTDEMAKAVKKRSSLNIWNTVIILLFMYFFKIGLAFVFVDGAVKSVITFAVIASLIGFSNQIGNPISSILYIISDIHATREVRIKVNKLLSNQQTNEADNPQADRLYLDKSAKGSQDTGDIILREVSFRYPSSDHVVLENLSITFHKGKKYLLLGQNGSGKSTLVSLLCGEYQGYGGAICANSKEIALVPPKSFVFRGTLRDNVTLYQNGYEDIQIKKALRQAGLDTVSDRFPNGLDTEIDEEGGDLSGGEKQRIAIARAFLSNRGFLILDEGTAELDGKLSEEIETTVLSSNKTVLVISHRISKNVQTYDAIAVLQDKHISFFGSYEEWKSWKEGEVFTNA
jgi:ATP-binding cassette subfamily C protein